MYIQPREPFRLSAATTLGGFIAGMGIFAASLRNGAPMR
jgi:hypothetical protein